MNITARNGHAPLVDAKCNSGCVEMRSLNVGSSGVAVVNLAQLEAAQSVLATCESYGKQTISKGYRVSKYLLELDYLQLSK